MLKGLDRFAPTWLAVSAWIVSEIAKLQKQLEQPGLDAGKTEHLRGRLFEMRRVLALADPAPPEIPSGPDDSQI